MQVTAIISEYNPFHNGHKYQIDKIREQIEDATIITIMSGNCVQRGEFAFINKYIRAELPGSSDLIYNNQESKIYTK